VCGKVIVATTEQEIPLFKNLYQRGLQNGLAIAGLRKEEVHKIEPHVRCLASIRVPTTGIVNFKSRRSTITGNSNAQ
jgi:(S)-2-hydroxyglutarate dehydrogenase